MMKLSKKRLLSLITILAMAPSLIAKDTTEDTSNSKTMVTQRTEINFNSDTDGNIHPQIAIPITWSEHFYSTLGYTSGSSTSIAIDDLDAAFNPSKFVTAQTDNMISFNLLSYQNTTSIVNYAFGLGVDYRNIESNEFGYFKTPSVNQLAFDKIVNIEQYDAVVNAEIYQTDIFGFMNFRVGGKVSIYSKMEVKQQTSYTNLPNTSASSSLDQEMNYTLFADLYFMTPYYFDIGLSASHGYLPLTYDLASPDFSNNTFTTINVKTEETITRFEAKVIITALKAGDLSPSIGAGYEYYDLIFNGESLDFPKNKLIIFGFEKKF